MSRMRGVLFASVTLIALAPAARAQLAAGGKLGWVTLNGDDFRGAGNAVGLEGFIRYQKATGLGLEGGAHFARHDLLDENLDVILVFVEPRLELPVGVGAARPFLGIRGSWARLESVEGGGEAAANGFAIGVVGGVTYALAQRVALEAALWYTTLSVGDLEVNGLSLPNSDRSGGMFAVHVGLTVSLNR